MPTTRRELLAGAAALPFSPLPCSAFAAAGEQELAFMSGGRAIRVDFFSAPIDMARAPAVIVLHGADGPNGNAMYRAGARAIAASGFNVYFVHYLDRTGEGRASLSSMFQNFALWMDVVTAALTFVEGRRESDADRVGIVGISLGAALGLAVAASDRRIRAVVDYFGPMPYGAITKAAHLPPILVLHGAADRVVPVENAYAVEALAREQGTPVELVVYPGQGHGFRGAAAEDATRRMLAFLEHQLASEVAGGRARAG
jgi:carboxymethylenebutenolidase